MRSIKSLPLYIFLFFSLCSVAGMCSKEKVEADVLNPEGKARITFGNESYTIMNAYPQTAPSGYYQLTVESTQTDGSRVGMVLQYKQKPVPGETITFRGGAIGDVLSPVYWYHTNAANTSSENRSFGLPGESVTVKQRADGKFIVFFDNLTPLLSGGGAGSGPKASGYIGE